MISLPRRKFISKSAKLSLVGGLLPYTQQDEDEVDIAIYVTEKAGQEWGMRKAYQFAAVVDNIFSTAVTENNVTISVEETIPVPQSETGTVKNAAEWWKHNNTAIDSAHSNLLLFSNSQTSWKEGYNGYGYYHSPFAVAKFYGLIGQNNIAQSIGIHEIGHNFDLQHEDAHVTEDSATVMYGEGVSTYRDILHEFSDTATQKIQDQIN